MKAAEYSARYSSLKPTRQTHSGWLERRIITLLKNRLANARGTLDIKLPSGYTLTLGSDIPQASLTLHNLRPFVRLFFGGSNGWSESYLNGDWDTDNISALIQWALVNEPAFESMATAQFYTGFLYNLYHRRRANTRAGSRNNIAAHYDLGNDFYRHWLDSSMTYSAALFDHPTQSLYQGQQNKYERITQLLNAKAGDHIVEIGCGWGGFASHAAQRHQLRVHGITLSQEQLHWAQQTLHERALEQRVNITLTDYRDLNQCYDGVVSIEMFEAVGEQNWDCYFDTLNRILKPGGTAVLQIITIDDERFHSYRRQADFIQRFVFPGGMLPGITVLQNKIREHGFQLQHQQLFGKDYARTLNIWHQHFIDAWPAISQLPGFDEHFYRLWRYYLAYCEGGFEHGSVDVGLYVIKRAE